MNKRNKNILLVNDNAGLSGYVKQGFENYYPTEYNVICINCVKNFFNMLKKSTFIPDVIILDLSMFEMRRWNVLNYLKHNPQWKFIPIIFFSGESNIVAKNFGKFFGDDYIEKTFMISELKDKIDRIFEWK